MTALLSDHYDFEAYRARHPRYSDPTCLYRYFDEDGDLLYVGVARWPWNRDLQHFGQSRWRPLATFMRVEVFPRRRLAEMAEALAISAERPLHNVKQPITDSTVYPADEWFLLPRGGRFIGDDPVWVSLPWPEGEHWTWSDPVICEAPAFAAGLTFCDRLEAEA